MNRVIQKVADFEELVRVAAREIIKIAQETIANKGSMAVALAGGSTPRKLYTFLASEEMRSKIAWTHIHFFWGDERHVPPDHQDSNFRMARETLLDQLPIQKDHIHPIPSHLSNAQEAANRYERELHTYFPGSTEPKPQFDLVLLGMGPDGHTASLFPGTSAIHETTRWVAAPWVEKFQTHRITLTPGIINEAAQVMFLVSGQDKSEALHLVLEGDYQPDAYPAQVIQPIHGRLLWLVDETAAGCLRSSLRI